jgi:hypothetical protein
MNSSKIAQEARPTEGRSFPRAKVLQCAMAICNGFAGILEEG